MYLVIILYMLFASLFTIQKDTLNYCEPFFLVGSRMVFAGLLMYLYLFFKQQKFNFKFEHLKGIGLLAISNIYMTNIFEIWAIKNMASSKACLIYSLSPFISGLVAYLVLNEKLSKKKFVGMLIGFLGLFPVVLTQTQEELSAGSFFIFTFAELSIVGAVFCSVYGWIMLKKVMTDYEYTPLMANSLSMMLGGVLALMHSYFIGEIWNPVPVVDLKPFLVNTMVMCVISNLICYNLYGYLLRKFTATFMSFAGLVTPLFASLFGFVFLGEVVAWHFFISMGFFAFGLWTFYREEIRKKHAFIIKEAVVDTL